MIPLAYPYPEALQPEDAPWLNDAPDDPWTPPEVDRRTRVLYDWACRKLEREQRMLREAAMARVEADYPELVDEVLAINCPLDADGDPLPVVFNPEQVATCRRYQALVDRYVAEERERHG